MIPVKAFYKLSAEAQKTHKKKQFPKNKVVPKKKKTIPKNKKVTPKKKMTAPNNKCQPPKKSASKKT